jgi:hypothetical protein
VACGVLAAFYGGVGGSPFMSVLHSAKLGDVSHWTPVDCPKGLLKPTSRGPNSKFTLLTVGLSLYADAIFIICTDEAGGCTS